MPADCSSERLSENYISELFYMKKRFASRILVFFSFCLFFFSVPAFMTEAKEKAVPDLSEEDCENCVVTLVAVGDNLLHEPVYTNAKKKNRYNFDHLYKHVKKDIMAADLAVINQETILVADDYSSYPCFGSPYAAADAIAKAGFDIVTQATNHTYDRGSSAILGTISYWRRKHPEITVLGIHRNQKEADTITVTESNGIRIALLNYTFWMNGATLPSGKEYLADLRDYSDRGKIRRDIRRAKKMADFVIVFPHWGTEYVYKPDENQLFWSDLFLEEKVDLVIGTHPHVLQPYRMRKGKDGHKMLCYYSLGNFISGQSKVPRMLGGMARITIVKDRNGTHISSYGLDPLVTHITNGYRLVTSYKLTDYTDALAKKHRLGLSVSGLKKLYTQITGKAVQSTYGKKK